MVGRRVWGWRSGQNKVKPSRDLSSPPPPPLAPRVPCPTHVFLDTESTNSPATRECGRWRKWQCVIRRRLARWYRPRACRRCRARRLDTLPVLCPSVLLLLQCMSHGHGNYGDAPLMKHWVNTMAGGAGCAAAAAAAAMVETVGVWGRVRDGLRLQADFCAALRTPPCCGHGCGRREESDDDDAVLESSRSLYALLSTVLSVAHKLHYAP